MVKKTILLIEDHPLFSRGLAQLIHSESNHTVIAEVQNSQNAIQIVQDRKPDLAIIDLNLGDEDGLNLIAQLRSVAPDLTMLVLSMHEERYFAERALHAGAKGYIMKAEVGAKVIDAINTVLAGKVWISEDEREHLLEHMIGGGRLENSSQLASVQSLSNRQLQVFKLIGEGWGTIEIAAKLNISIKTVDTHKAHLKEKLHCSSSQELRLMAVEWAKY
ncbi:MAG: response regulator [Spirochaeta sp.]